MTKEFNPFQNIVGTHEKGQPVAEDGRVGQVVDGDGGLERRTAAGAVCCGDQGTEIDLAVALALEVDYAREVGGGHGQDAADGGHHPRQDGERAQAPPRGGPIGRRPEVAGGGNLSVEGRRDPQPPHRVVRVPRNEKFCRGVVDEHGDCDRLEDGHRAEGHLLCRTQGTLD